jgi:predicted O-linked N-acetylglucosamine transferase (SPINDLY family)
MGVPVVVVEGDRFASRMGQSVLTRVGLMDWIARDIDHYVALAIARACDVEGLSELRGSLRDQLARSPVGDAARFTREMEAVYERLWQQHRSTRNALRLACP